MSYLVDEPVIHRTPSVGTVIKKCLGINPALTAPELIDIVRRSSRPLGDRKGEFAAVEAVDEAVALELARATLV